MLGVGSGFGSLSRKHEAKFKDTRCHYLMAFVETNAYTTQSEVCMEFSGFDWDRGNLEKCQKHGISAEVIESVFDRPVAILPDETHSRTEQRLRAIGKTAERRAIFVVFTLRRRGDEILIRPISARYMHDKEVKNYEKENPNL
jgi:uncharacterized DUF497 family protein